MAHDDLLCVILNCGPLDLKMLDNVGYDWADVIERVKEDGLNLTDVGFDGLMMTVVEMAIEDLAAATSDIIHKVEDIANGREFNPEAYEALAELQHLNPFEDFDGSFNYLNTHVWFKNNEEIYRVYLQKALNTFEENTGLTLEGEYGTIDGLTGPVTRP